MTARSLLILSAILIALLWQLPYGRQLLYPLTLFATYAHEMGHGLTAVLVGAQFERLLLHTDGSGLAVWRGSPAPVATALIAAGGLVGPTFAGIGLLLLARTPRLARAGLTTLAVLMLATVALWARNTFAVVFLLAFATALLLAARLLPDFAAALVPPLIALTLCLSWFTDLDYMFSAQAEVGGVLIPSDSAIMAQALWLPYWFWGAIVAAFSLVVVVAGIRFASRDYGGSGDNPT